MKKKICVLTSAHPIDDVRVYRKIALTLIKEFEVIWIGPNVHFFESELHNDGIERHLFLNKKGIIGRLINNYRVIKMFLWQKGISTVYIPDPDLAFFYVILAKSKKINVIFDIHEVYHKDLLQRKVRGFFYPLFCKLIKNIIKTIASKVDLTIGVSATVLNYYVSNKKPHMIIRSCLPQDIIDFTNIDKKKKDDFTIVHGKNHMSRGTLVVLKALNILKEKKIKCKVLMIEQNSSNNDFFYTSVDKFNLNTYIEIHNGMPFVEMQKQMSQCNVGLIAYGRDLGVDSLPNRFFEYLSIGIPVIVPCFSKEMVDIVKKEECGIFVDTENSKELADSFEFLINNPKLAKEMGDRGRIAFLDRHNWEIEIKPLIDYINQNNVKTSLK